MDDLWKSNCAQSLAGKPGAAPPCCRVRWGLVHAGTTGMGALGYFEHVLEPSHSKSALP